MKLLLRIILWLFIGLIIALILVPFLFKGELHNVIKEKLNEQIHAEVEFEDLQLSLFSAFPYSHRSQLISLQILNHL